MEAEALTVLHLEAIRGVADLAAEVIVPRQVDMADMAVDIIPRQVETRVITLPHPILAMVDTAQLQAATPVIIRLQRQVMVDMVMHQAETQAIIQLQLQADTLEADSLAITAIRAIITAACQSVIRMVQATTMATTVTAIS